jgi:hypothetical protein
MDPDPARCAQPTIRLGGVDRPDMAARDHLPRREAEGADRQQRKPNRAVRRRLIGPIEVPRTGVTRKEQIAAGQAHDEARPQSAVAIGEPAAAPMVIARDHHLDAWLHGDLPAPV